MELLCGLVLERKGKGGGKVWECAVARHVYVS